MINRIGYHRVILGASTAVTVLAWRVRSTFASFYVAMFGRARMGPRGDGARLLAHLARFVVFAPVAGWLFDPAAHGRS